jgi:hypothetical protein
MTVRGQPRADVMTSWIAIFGYARSELLLPSLPRTEESRSRVPLGSIRSLPPSNWCQTISSPSNTCQRPARFSRQGMAPQSVDRTDGLRQTPWGDAGMRREAPWSAAACRRFPASLKLGFQPPAGG